MKQLPFLMGASVVILGLSACATSSEPSKAELAAQAKAERHTQRNARAQEEYLRKKAEIEAAGGTVIEFGEMNISPENIAINLLQEEKCIAGHSTRPVVSQGPNGATVSSVTELSCVKVNP